MAWPQTINASASPEVQENENASAIQWSGVYSHNAPADSGLTRGYNGGRWSGFVVADVAHTFGASTTTYVSVKRADGSFDFQTTSTNYNDPSNYAKVETVVTGTATVTSTTDDRGGPGGVHGGRALLSPAILATVTGINSKTVARTNLYTVPAGRVLVVTDVIVRCTAASAITVAAQGEVGVSAGDIKASATLTGVLASGTAFQFADGVGQLLATAAQVVAFGIGTAATGTSQTVAVDLVGYLV